MEMITTSIILVMFLLKWSNIVTSYFLSCTYTASLFTLVI